jgi:hypothetical protein
MEKKITMSLTIQVNENDIEENPAFRYATLKIPETGKYCKWLVDFGSYHCVSFDNSESFWIHKSFLKILNRFAGLKRIDQKMYLFPFNFNHPSYLPCSKLLSLSYINPFPALR